MKRETAIATNCYGDRLEYKKLLNKIYDDSEKEYSELEFKLGCILDRVTGGCISKPHTDVPLINEAIHRQVLKEWKYAVDDYKETHPVPTLENIMCKWTEEDDNVYRTNCKNMFQLSNDDNPKENGLKFCPYCGGEIEIGIHMDKLDEEIVKVYNDVLKDTVEHNDIEFKHEE